MSGPRRTLPIVRKKFGGVQVGGYMMCRLPYYKKIMLYLSDDPKNFAA